MSHRVLLAVLLAALMGLIVQTAAADDTTPVRLAGQLTKIDGQNFTIASETDGKATTITCNNATQYRQDGSKDPLTFASFKVGQKVRTYYRSADNVALTVILVQVPATTQAAARPVRLVGALTKIDGKAITVTGDTDGKAIVLTCTDATQYRQDGTTVTVTFDAFKVGQTVRVYYYAKDNTVQNLILTKAP